MALNAGALSRPHAPIAGPAALVASESTLDIELGEIRRHRRRFHFLSIATIIVSFAHMVTTLLLYSHATWFEWGAAVLMTILIDVTTWILASYLDYAKRKNLTRSQWVKALFGIALMISGVLNFGYLYANMPPDDKIPQFLSGVLAFAFGFFIPGSIGVAALVGGELEDDATKLRMNEVKEVSLAQQLNQRISDLLAELAEQGRIRQSEAAQHQLALTAADAERRDQTRLLEDQIAALQTKVADLEQSRKPGRRRPADTVVLETQAEQSQPETQPAGHPALTLVRPEPAQVPDEPEQIDPNDVDAIVAAMRRAGVTQIHTARDLRPICGWKSFSVAQEGLVALQASGAVSNHVIDNAMVYVLAETVEAPTPPHVTLDEFLASQGIPRAQAVAFLGGMGKEKAIERISSRPEAANIPRATLEAWYDELVAVTTA